MIFNTILPKTNPSEKNKININKVSMSSNDKDSNNLTLEKLKLKYDVNFSSEEANTKGEKSIKQSKNISSIPNDIDFLNFKTNESKPKKLYSLLANFKGKFIIKKILKNNKAKKYLRLSLWKSENSTNKKFFEILHKSNITFQQIYPYANNPYNNHTLKIFSLNINHIKNKILELNALLENYNVDIACIQETHNQNDHIYLDNYKIIEQPETHGLLIAISKSKNFQYEIFINKPNIIGIRLFSNKNSINIVNVYIPHSKILKENVYNHITTIIDKNTFICGDWNEKTEKIENIFKNTIIHAPNSPTRKIKDHIANRIIDYAITKNLKLDIKTKIIYYDISDHFPIQFKINFKIKHEKTQIFDRKKLQNLKKC